MNRLRILACDRLGPALLAGTCILVLVSSTANLAALELDGFTEPYRKIQVAAVESGVVRQLHVAEGEQVEPGQILAVLDHEIHLALLEIAKANMSARGQLDVAFAELQMQRKRLAKLEELRRNGHARQEEVTRALADVAISEGRLKSVEEDLVARELEYKKVQVQLERRNVRSPIGGTVSEIHRLEGEYMAPSHPDLATVVVLDPLLATFSIPDDALAFIQAGQTVKLLFVNSQRRTEGTVELVAPLTDAESGTVRVKVRIPNGQRQFRSGERVLMRTPNSH